MTIFILALVGMFEFVVTACFGISSGFIALGGMSLGYLFSEATSAR